MSRSGYSDDYDNWELVRWRGAVVSAIRGKRGQQLLREMAEALDSMPAKRLIRDDFQTPDGEVCALGCLGVARGIEMQNIDPYDRYQVATVFGIAPALAAEIMFMNDDYGLTPEQRWLQMRQWIAEQLRESNVARTCSVAIENGN